MYDKFRPRTSLHSWLIVFQSFFVSCSPFCRSRYNRWFRTNSPRILFVPSGWCVGFLFWTPDLIMSEFFFKFGKYTLRFLLRRQVTMLISCKALWSSCEFEHF
jgi:hypothetical protein